MGPYTGHMAALGAAVGWSVCSLCFASVGNRVGSIAVGVVRLSMAFVMFCLYGALVRGLPLPTDATMHAWIYLSISGVVGFFLGDVFLFRSYLLIGPRLGLLAMATWPAMAAAIAWLLMRETLVGLQVVGIAVTLAGVAWVISERQARRDDTKAGPSIKGIALALLGALGQAIGLVLSKIGMQCPDGGPDYDAFAATQVRAVSALVAYFVLVAASRRWKNALDAITHRRSALLLLLGAAVGPFAGVALSLIAVQHTQAGVAATLMATAPVMVIPMVVVLRLEKVSVRAICGAVVAVAGVGILFLGR